MKNQFSLEVKTPCSENFNKFKPTPDGGFCSSCEKEVIDFTKMNAQETISYFKNKSNTDACGRFNSNQLKTYTRKPKQEKRLNFLSGIGLACLSLFSFGTMQAQDIKKHTEDSGDKPSKFRITKHEKDIIVKGNVTEEGLPMPGVNVVLEGTRSGVQTDFDGNFKFPVKLKKGDVLIFSFLGMKTQKVVINDEHSVSKIELKIDMTMEGCVIMGRVAVKDIFSSEKNN